MLDYEAWNPDFSDGKVTRIRGESRGEGELVLIELVGGGGEPLSPFYAETVKVLPPHRLVWYVYPKKDESFRNFVDFRLRELPSGVTFSIDYYAQNLLSGDALARLRQESEAGLRNLAAAFEKHCEARP